MPKNSGQANRQIGLNHGNGKGDKTRVTDVKAYRENFDEINWRPRLTVKEIIRLGQRLRTLREIEDEEFAWRHGL